MSTALRHATLNKQQLRLEDPYATAASRQTKVCIQTQNGMDLGSLLAQDVRGNAFNDHIFADDDSTGSPAASSVISDTDLSRVSILNIHCAEEPEPEDEVEQENESTPESQDITIDEWELCNRQFGKEVAQHFRDKVRAREEERNSKYSIQFPDESASLSCHSMGSSLFQCAGPHTHDRAAFLASEKSHEFNFEATSSKHGKNESSFSKYIKKLRKKRRAFLDTIFTSKAASKAVSSAEVGSQGSTASTVSLVDQISPKSGVSDPSQAVTAVKEEPSPTQPHERPRDFHAEEVAIKDKKTTKPIRRFGPHMRARSAPIIDTTSGQDVSMHNRHSSPVVDSILKQFSTPIHTAKTQGMTHSTPNNNVHRRSSVGTSPFPTSTSATSVYRRASVDNGVYRQQSFNGTSQRVPKAMYLGNQGHQYTEDMRCQHSRREQVGSVSFGHHSTAPLVHDNRKFHL